MTPTTDREEFEKWFELTCGLPWGFLAKRREPSGRYMEIPHEDAWQVWQASRELLANREAQPVGKDEITKIAAELVRGDYLSKLWTEAEKSRHVDTHRLQNLLDELHDVMKVKAIAVTRLLTAPPAPANAQPAGYFVRHRSIWNNPSTWSLWTECSAEDYAEYCKRIATGEADAGRFYEARILYDAPPAPAVPPEATPENIENLLADITLFFTAGSLSHGGSVMFAEVWNACRAAMLAQPVSSGYTLLSGWIACSERMPELDKRVLLYFGSYGGHIEDGCIGDDGDGPYHYFFDGDSMQQEPTHWMSLPAAPEGGNG